MLCKELVTETVIAEAPLFATEFIVGLAPPQSRRSCFLFLAVYQIFIGVSKALAAAAFCKGMFTRTLLDITILE